MSRQEHLLLIISCSQRKRRDPSLLPAIERYDGVTFRLLRKAKREGTLPQALDVAILSARYGLVAPSTPIADYEQRMTAERASQLSREVAESLAELAQAHHWREAYVDLGQEYLPTVQACRKSLGACRVIYAHGRIGERLRALKQWLSSHSLE